MEQSLEWVRYQLERLVGERVEGPLSEERSAKYADLCAEERRLLNEQD